MMLLALILIGTGAAMAQTQASGTVTDQQGEPMIGVTVHVKGNTTTGTITDIDGKFALSVPKGSTLVISYVGYKTQELPATAGMKVVLTDDTEQLDEVFVVAYGTSKRSAFTGSATVINSDALTKKQATNVVQALAGQVAGLQMTSGSGQAGGDAPTMLLRGIGSINASTGPLIIVDGAPYDGGWDNINPADVESISVLKDAASNALYGARGANGVIIITTKNAKSGEAVITASAKWGANTRGTIDYDYIKDPGQYYEAQYRALYNKLHYVDKLSADDAYVQANQDLVSGVKEKGGLAYNVYSYPDGQYLIGKDGKLNPNATLGRVVNGHMLLPDDWTKEAYSTSLRQEYNVNVTGGNEALQLYSSFGYLKDNGVLPNSGYERYSARVKASHQAKKWLKYGMNVGYVYSTTQTLSESESTDPTSFTQGIAPIYPVYLRDANGNIRTDQNGKMYDYGVATAGPKLVRPAYSNLSIQTMMLDLQQTKAHSLNGNAFTDILFSDELKFTFNAATSVFGQRYFTSGNPFYGWGIEEKGNISVYHYRTTTLNLQQLLNYNHTFGDSHNFSALLGHEYYKYNYVQLSASKKNMFSYWGNHELEGAVIDGKKADSYATNYNTEGYFFRGLYDYNGKYFASASFRRDASSRFHPKHRWGNFYSLGGAYLISNEEFFKCKAFDMLKIKFSIGQQGNDNIDDFYYTDRYGINNNNDALSLSFSDKGKEDITWETNTNVNLGAEFELWKGKLTGDVELFYRKTTDMLNFFTVPPSLGYNGYYDNIGDMENRGVELDLHYTPIKRKDLVWTINFNLTHYKNKITYLPEDKKTNNEGGYDGYVDGIRYYGEGLPINTWRIHRFAGLSPEGKSLWYYTDKTTGEEKTTDSFSNADYYLCGDPNPDLYGGFGTSLSFRGFDFSAQFSYSVGGKIYDYGYAGMMSNPIASSASGFRLHKDVFNAWSPENTSSEIPRWYFNDLDAAGQSDRFLIDGSYLNLQNIQLGYTVPEKLTKRLGGVRNLRFYVTCDNIYYWSKRKGLDPRTTTTGSTSSAGVSPYRTYSAGLSLQF